jgi:hypothetical protein
MKAQATVGKDAQQLKLSARGGVVVRPQTMKENDGWVSILLPSCVRVVTIT